MRRYPDEILAAQLDYPKLYLEKWDAESRKQRVVGVAANDCHHNQVFLVKMVDENTVLLGTIVDDDEDMRKITAAQRPGIREMTKGRKPGDVLIQLDFDPYRVSFHNVSTHVLAPELTEPAVRAAVKAGHVYVSHDWMCDPTGFAFVAVRESAAAEFAVQTRVGIMGDEVEHNGDLRLVAEFPLPCMVRILKDGKEISRSNGDRVQLDPDGPGVYRVEGWLTVDGEERVWVYSNPIYLR